MSSEQRLELERIEPFTGTTGAVWEMVKFSHDAPFSNSINFVHPITLPLFLCAKRVLWANATGSDGREANIMSNQRFYDQL